MAGNSANVECPVPLPFGQFPLIVTSIVSPVRFIILFEIKAIYCIIFVPLKPLHLDLEFTPVQVFCYYIKKLIDIDIMNFITLLLTPFYYLSVLLYRLRERLFGYDIVYRYLPKEIDKHFLPVHMDLFWIRRGFLGRNKCLVPKGDPYSARFDENSPWFQTWVGTYFLRSLKKIKHQSQLKEAMALGSAAIEDQNFWLISYGVPHPNSMIVKQSIKKLSERTLNGFNQKIYYGEIKSGVDDSRSNKYDFTSIHIGSTKIASIYNGSKVNPKLLQKDKHPSMVDKVDLFGYFSVIELNPQKFLLTYVCGTKENKEKIDAELIKIINNIGISTPM